jgi:hypothetical protein
MQRVALALDQARKLFSEIQHWDRECVRVIENTDGSLWDNAYANKKIAETRFNNMAPALLRTIVEGK